MLLNIADRGKTTYVISLARKAPAPERNAARELAAYLGKISGARFRLRAPSELGSRPCFAVGSEAALRAGLPASALRGLGDEGILVRTIGGNIVLTGGPGALRGTLYAVYTFLEEALGCRWWAPDIESIPRMERIEIPPFNKRFVPALEYRETFMRGALEARWSIRNKVNALNAWPNITDEWGGRVIYNPGHSFHALVPPAQHFATHPEWYSEKDGKRSETGQLCLTNRQLASFVTARVREQLRGLPRGTIVSVAQDDNVDYCRCRSCQAMDRKEGSPAGTLLRFVNIVAAGIEKEFPQSAINTFAYIYTRNPPRHVKARRNVVIQLCSYECDFLHPMTHQNNRPFYRDLEKWSRTCRRLYIWDYSTNFAHYIQPHPSWYVFGENIRCLVKNGVKGIFNEGNYQSSCGEMAPLRAWVLAKLMWDPSQSNEALVHDFLHGYYGRAGAHIENYMRRVHAEAMAAGDYPGSLSMRRLIKNNPRYADSPREGLYLDLGVPPDAPHLAPDVVLEALRHFRAAEDAVKGNAVLRERVRIACLPVIYVTLIRWAEIRKRASETGQEWLLPRSRDAALRAFGRSYKKYGITHLGEGAPHAHGMAWLGKVLQGKEAFSW